MRNYTVESPTFTKAIRIVEEDDLVNEENDTAAAKQLIGNDLVLNDRMEKCLGKDPDHGDSKDLIVTFDSGDAASADAWTDMDVMQSKDEHKSLFRKISIMMKNVRYIYRLLGTTDISRVGDGTVTNAIKELKEEQPGTVSKTKAGLVPQLPNEDKSTKYLRQDGTWKTPPDTKYTHPTTHAASMITQDATHRFVSDTEKDTWNNKLNKSDVSQSTAVTVTGQKALDAVEKNAAVPGTMAYDLAQINSNLIENYTKSKIIDIATQAIGKSGTLLDLTALNSEINKDVRAINITFIDQNNIGQYAWGSAIKYRDWWRCYCYSTGDAYFVVRCVCYY